MIVLFEKIVAKVLKIDDKKYDFQQNLNDSLNELIHRMRRLRRQSRRKTLSEGLKIIEMNQFIFCE